MERLEIRVVPRGECASWWFFGPEDRGRARISEVECGLCLPVIWHRAAGYAGAYLWRELVEHLAHVHGARPEPLEAPAEGTNHLAGPLPRFRIVDAPQEIKDEIVYRMIEAAAPLLGDWVMGRGQCRLDFRRREGICSCGEGPA
jgi:hypothetical protein